MVCAWFLCAQIAGAQSVQGIVVARGESPVAGVVVLLLDTNSTIAARALSNAGGVFRLVAPRAGSYHLRTLRIGFTPATSAPFALVTGASREQRIELTELSYSLDTTRVAARSVCRRTSPESLAVVFALWEQVRTALHAAELTASGGSINATTLRYARLLSRDMSRVMAQANEFQTDSVRAPWQSMAPDTLHERGYVRTGADDSVTYAAPGLDALVSDTFLDDHCFSLAAGTDDEFRIVFEPARNRNRLPEISGTVSVNRATTELRRIEYKYVNLPPVQMTQAGGDVAFVRLREGGWVIPYWNVRMPVLGMFRGVGRARELRVARVKVEGGELVAALRGGDTLWTHPPLVLSGRVLDSVSGAPVAGAWVSVSGSKLKGETARDGSFRIAGLLPGRYGLEVRGPGREYAGMAVAIPVTFTDSASHVDLRIPTALQVAGAVCQLEWLVTAVSGGAILTGHVDASFIVGPRSAVTVVAEWTEKHGRIAGRGITYEYDPMSFETLADSAGEFRICFVPTETPIRVHATVGDIRALDARVTIPPELHFARVNLTLDSNLEPVTSLATTVLGDSTTGPLAGAEVTLPEFSLFGTTDDRGVVRLSEVALGAHRLTVRREGFVPLDTMITVGKGRVTNLPLVLRKQDPGSTPTMPAPFSESGDASGNHAALRTPLPPPLPTRGTASRECSPPSLPPEARRARAAAACVR
ncbi:hypothetical protein BH09GEM1_BH09GEM1_30120 [soil metagenome]